MSHHCVVTAAASSRRPEFTSGHNTDPHLSRAHRTLASRRGGGRTHPQGGVGAVTSARRVRRAVTIRTSPRRRQTGGAVEPGSLAFERRDCPRCRPHPGWVSPQQGPAGTSRTQQASAGLHHQLTHPPEPRETAAHGHRIRHGLIIISERQITRGLLVSPRRGLSAVSRRGARSSQSDTGTPVTAPVVGKPSSSAAV